MATPTVVPTQVRRPWRATFRTAFQFVVAFAVLLPFIVDATGLEPEVYPWLGGALAIAAALTRVMALPQVEAFLQQFVPWLAATPPREVRKEDGRADVVTVLAVVVLVVVLLAVLGVL